MCAWMTIRMERTTGTNAAFPKVKAKPISLSASLKSNPDKNMGNEEGGKTLFSLI